RIGRDIRPESLASEVPWHLPGSSGNFGYATRNRAADTNDTALKPLTEMRVHPLWGWEVGLNESERDIHEWCRGSLVSPSTGLLALTPTPIIGPPRSGSNRRGVRQWFQRRVRVSA